MSGRAFLPPIAELIGAVGVTYAAGFRCQLTEWLQDDPVGCCQREQHGGRQPNDPGGVDLVVGCSLLAAAAAEPGQDGD